MMRKCNSFVRSSSTHEVLNESIVKTLRNCERCVELVLGQHKEYGHESRPLTSAGLRSCRLTPTTRQKCLAQTKASDSCLKGVMNSLRFI